MNWSTHGISTSIHCRAGRRARAAALKERLAYVKPPPGVMTAEEIRYWLNALLTVHGWTPTGLGRTLGMKHPAQHIPGKANGTNWLYRTEQLRFSRVLKRIISGELVHRPYTHILSGCRLADHPVPLPQPVRYEFDPQVGKVVRILPRREGTSTVPSFQTALKNAGRWRECTFPVEERRERDP